MVQPSSEKAGAVETELPLLMVQVLKAMIEEITGGPHHHDHQGMTPMHSIAVRYLDARDDVTTVELAEFLRVTKQSASEIVAVLEREGVVRRRPHPEDGRARIVELTAAGRSGLGTSRDRWNEIVRGWEAVAGADDVAVVRRALERYLDAHPPATRSG